MGHSRRLVQNLHCFLVITRELSVLSFLFVITVKSLQAHALFEVDHFGGLFAGDAFPVGANGIGQVVNAADEFTEGIEASKSGDCQSKSTLSMTA